MEKMERMESRHICLLLLSIFVWLGFSYANIVGSSPFEFLSSFPAHFLPVSSWEGFHLGHKAI